MKLELALPIFFWIVWLNPTRIGVVVHNSTEKDDDCFSSTHQIITFCEVGISSTSEAISNIFFALCDNGPIHLHFNFSKHFHKYDFSSVHSLPVPSENSLHDGKAKILPLFLPAKMGKCTAFCDHICCQMSQKLPHTAFLFFYHRNLHKLGFPHICIMFDDRIVSLTLRPGQLWVAGRTRYNFMKLIRDWYNLHKNSRVNSIM